MNLELSYVTKKCHWIYVTPGWVAIITGKWVVKVIEMGQHSSHVDWLINNGFSLGHAIYPTSSKILHLQPSSSSIGSVAKSTTWQALKSGESYIGWFGSVVNWLIGISSHFPIGIHLCSCFYDFVTKTKLTTHYGWQGLQLLFECCHSCEGGPNAHAPSPSLYLDGGEWVGSAHIEPLLRSEHFGTKIHLKSIPMEQIHKALINHIWSNN